MNKIRVKSNSLYKIEVNDKGETIEFDLADPGLPLKLIDCYDKLKNLMNKMENEKGSITEKEDEEFNDITTIKQKENLELIQNYFIEARNILDIFLGKNACQKIFGDSNWSTMFEDLFEKLNPEFEKMGINIKNAQKNMANKYKNKDKRILG